MTSLFENDASNNQIRCQTSTLAIPYLNNSHPINQHNIGGIMMQEKAQKLNPLQTYKEWESDYKAQKTQRELQDIRQGFFKRQDKIMLLEAELYTRIQDGDEIEDVVTAIEVLQTNKISDEELRAKQDNSFTAQFNAVFGYMIMLGIVATGFSYVALPLCQNSHSRFCTTARVIPNMISDFYREPVNIK